MTSSHIKPMFIACALSLLTGACTSGHAVRWDEAYNHYGASPAGGFNAERDAVKD